MTKYGSVINVNDSEEGNECVHLCSNSRVVEEVSIEKPWYQHPSKPSSYRLFIGGVVVLAAFFLIGFDHHKGGVQKNQVEEETPLPPLFYDPDSTPLEDREPQNIPRFFTQKVDHLDPSNTKTWQHRYYAQAKHFKGPGHPIILCVGGEDANDDGFFYAFVEEQLAAKYGAFALAPEHRFYGVSQPVDPAVATTKDLVKLLTVKNAILDMLTMVQHFQKELGCSTDKSDPRYCPVISVGGSYPGFVSAMMRLHYPDIVDMAYASSAPLLLYGMEADQFGYFDVVTRTAEEASPGCSDAVRKTLAEVDEALRGSTDGFLKIAHEKLNICPGSVPEYSRSGDVMSQELMMVVSNAFADMNMFNYPPSNETNLALACSLFQDESLDSFEKLVNFWPEYLDENIDPDLPCFDMSSQLPTGRNPTISGSDWSGIGTGHDGEMFDFHCCATLTPPVGFSKDSMFPYRPWSLEWLTEHCQSRFGITPDPLKLVREFKFDDLVGQGATRILFTNGLNDLWHAGSILEPLSKDLPVVNMKTGAHHSELRYSDDMEMDTEDVRRGHEKITKILSGWLNEVKGEEIY